MLTNIITQVTRDTEVKAEDIKPFRFNPVLNPDPSIPVVQFDIEAGSFGHISGPYYECSLYIKTEDDMHRICDFREKYIDSCYDSFFKYYGADAIVRCYGADIMTKIACSKIMCHQWFNGFTTKPEFDFKLSPKGDIIHIKDKDISAIGWNVDKPHKYVVLVKKEVFDEDTDFEKLASAYLYNKHTYALDVKEVSTLTEPPLSMLNSYAIVCEIPNFVTEKK